MTALTLPEIRTLKTAMDQRILEAATAAVTRFQLESGLKVTDVRVVLYDRDEIGKAPQSLVARVESSVDLQL